MGNKENLFRAAIIKTIDIFNFMKIKYAIIGGIAVARHGITRATIDIDLIADIKKIEISELLKRFKQEGFNFTEQNAIKELAQDSFSQIIYEDIAVDILLPVIPLFFKIIERGKEEITFGHTMRIATPEDLILLKLLSFRETDRDDIKGILATNREQLNVEYIFDWIRRTIKPDDIKIRDFQDLIDKYY